MANAEIKTILTADASQLERTLQKAEKSASNLGRGGISGAGGGGLGGLAGAFGSVATKAGIAGAAVGGALLAVKQGMDLISSEGAAAEQLNMTSSALGIGTEQLQAFAFMAKQTGNVTQDELTGKLYKLQNSVDEVVGGSESMAKSFQNLGISQKEVVSLPMDKLLERIAQGARKSGTAVGDLNDIFGRGAAQALIGPLRELADKGFDRLTESAKQAGQVIEDDTLKRLENAGDRIEAFGQRLKNMGTRTLGAILGGLGIGPSDEQLEAARQAKLAEMEMQRQQKVAANELRLKEEAAKKQAAIDSKVLALNAKKAELAMSPTIQALDSFARIGAGSGSKANQIDAMAKASYELQRKQTEIDKQILEVLKNG
jgi:hypothetical protein